jgi:hypothetical protein
MRRSTSDLCSGSTVRTPQDAVRPGGVEPHWAPNGELFFRNKNQMFVVRVSTRPDLTVTAPRKLFDGPYALSAIQDRSYDVTPDGQRFLIVRHADAAQGTVRLNAIVNWFDALKEKPK